MRKFFDFSFLRSSVKLCSPSQINTERFLPLLSGSSESEKERAKIECLKNNPDVNEKLVQWKWEWTRALQARKKLMNDDSIQLCMYVWERNSFPLIIIAMERTRSNLFKNLFSGRACVHENEFSERANFALYWF
jgi:hypothetical protein